MYLLESHSAVKKVNYPGLENHTQHELAKRQQHGFGGIESLICHPVTMTHASMNPVLREQTGINERVIRLSVGIEDVNDLIEDLDQAVNVLG
jgi:cystathionine gamma-synthase